MANNRTTVRLPRERVRTAAEAGNIPYCDDLVEAIDSILADPLTWNEVEFEQISLVEVREELVRAGKAVKKAAKSLSNLDRKEDGLINESIRDEAAWAADGAGFSDPLDHSVYPSLRRAVSMLQSLHHELESRAQLIAISKGRRKAPEHQLVLSLHRVFLNFKGVDSLTWDGEQSKYRGACVEFIDAILESPELKSKLPPRRARVGEIIHQFRQRTGRGTP